MTKKGTGEKRYRSPLKLLKSFSLKKIEAPHASIAQPTPKIG